MRKQAIAEILANEKVTQFGGTISIEARPLGLKDAEPVPVTAEAVKRYKKLMCQQKEAGEGNPIKGVHRPITPEDMTKEGDRNYDLGRKHAKEEIAIHLSNDSKIRACNFFHAMQNHMGGCEQCCEYLHDGDGDLCEHGKEIIAREMAYTDMTPDFRDSLPTDDWRRLMPR